MDLTAALVDLAGVAVIAVDLDNRVTHWNREAEKLFGFTAEETIGQTSTTVGIAPADKPEAQGILDQILAGREWTGQFPVMTKSGAYKRMHFHAGPVTGEDGAVRGVVVVADDAGRRAEAATSLSLFQAAIGQSPVGVGVYDHDLRYIRVNAALLEIIGRPEDEVVGHSVVEVLGEELGERVSGYLTRVFATGEPLLNLEFETRTPAHPDEDRWYQVSYFRLTEDDGSVVAAASLVTDVTEQRRVAERLRDATERLAILGQVSELLASSLDLDKTLAALSRLVVPAFADHVVVDLFDDAGELRRQTLLHAPDLEPEGGEPWTNPGDVVVYPDGHPCAIALATARSVLLSGEPSDVDYEALAPSQESAAYARKVGVTSAIAVPLVVHGATLGLVSFASSQPTRRYGVDDQRLAEEIAVRASVAIDNAQLFRRERRTALTLQRSLLPGTVPETPELAARAAYSTAGEEGEQVGGDWYDVIPLASGRVAIVIGDVMGRGIHAAALMGQLRAVVRGYAVQDLPPADVIAYLDVVVRDLDDASIVTCIYGVYDPLDRAICLANAGHVPPLLVSPSGSVETVQEKSLVALGAGLPPFEQVEIEFPVGAALVLYTDGVVETRGSDLDEGITRLAEAVVPLPVDLDAACRRVLDVSTDGQDDDAATLIVRAKPAPLIAVADRAFSPEAPMNALLRGFTVDALTRWGASPNTVQLAELVVSELVTNVIRYGVSSRVDDPRLRVARRGNDVVIEVTDWNGTLPHRRQAAPHDETGRGLALVDAYTGKWGARPILGGGKVVWCTIPWEM